MEPAFQFEAASVALVSGGIAFCAMGTGYIGSLNTATSVLTQWHIPNGSPGHLQVSGACIAFTDTKLNVIASLDTTTGQLTTWAIPTASDVPWGLVQGSTTRFYFVESVSNKIAMLDTVANSITEWPVTSVTKLQHLFLRSGILYFGDFQSSIVGKLNPSTGLITEFTAPSSKARILDLLVSSRLIYFAESNGNKLAVLNPASQTGVTTRTTPVVIVITPVKRALTPTTTTLHKLNTVVTPAATSTTGVITGGFTEWALPNVSSWPQA